MQETHINKFSTPFTPFFLRALKLSFLIVNIFLFSNLLLARELRGAWIATVKNIDWPSSPALAPEDQKKEFLEILNIAKKLKLNALFLHVRPNSDAFYASSIEPWSRFLTGSQGTSPSPFWDPLEFAIHEAHQKGIEIHAWINPFSAGTIKNAETSHPTHIVNSLPHAIREYGIYKWCDPSQEEVHLHISRVISDIVTRYKIDGVVLDDFFYPYPIKKAEDEIIDFPDQKNWTIYYSEGGSLSRESWRRNHVNRLIKNTYSTIKSIKPWVKFGISPFGIYRPGHPEGVTGLDQYAKLYADPLFWVQNGWCDYLSPQLYWPENSEGQCFSKLLDWWTAQSRPNLPIIPSLATYLVENSIKTTVTEISNQIKRVRSTIGTAGHVHFSMNIFKKDPKSLCSTLTENHYLFHELPPITYGYQKQDTFSSTTLTLSFESQSSLLKWNYPSVQINDIKFFSIYQKSGDTWNLIDLIGSNLKEYMIPSSLLFENKLTLGVSAVNLYNMESQMTTITLP